jgi:hypothetical protein
MHCHSAQQGRICEECRKPTIPDPAIKRFPRYAPKQKPPAKNFYCVECGTPQVESVCVRHKTVNIEYTESMRRAHQLKVKIFSNAFEQGKRS